MKGLSVSLYHDIHSKMKLLLFERGLVAQGGFRFCRRGFFCLYPVLNSADLRLPSIVTDDCRNKHDLHRAQRRRRFLLPTQCVVLPFELQPHPHRRRRSVNFRGHDIFARKMCMKN